MNEAQRLESVRGFDNDLEGSCGLHPICKRHPNVFVRGRIMERGNFSAASGFGSSPGKQGIYGTFSAFLEMCVSEITMSRLNFSNVLAHFSVPVRHLRQQLCDGEDENLDSRALAVDAHHRLDGVRRTGGFGDLLLRRLLWPDAW